jgi:hypothetical protein
VNDLPVDWAVATATRGGEIHSGDRHIVQARPDGVLIGAIDGIGHGIEAARAADRAIEVLSRHSDETLLSLVRRCHDALIGTRGAVMSLARFNVKEHTIAWIGIGNIEGLVVRRLQTCDARHEGLLLRSGVVGGRLPPLMVSVLPVAAGDAVIFATDGIAPDFAESVMTLGAPQIVADRLIARHSKGTDDALALVARYVGP